MSEEGHKSSIQFSMTVSQESGLPVCKPKIARRDGDYRAMNPDAPTGIIVHKETGQAFRRTCSGWVAIPGSIVRR